MTLPPRIKLNRSTLIWAVPVAVAGIVAAVIVAAVIVVNWGTTEHTQYKKSKSVDSCKQIRLGMTKEQVLKIMPEPVGTISYKRRGREKEKVLFPSRAAASIPPHTVIDRSTDRVEEVVCNDKYRLRKDQT